MADTIREKGRCRHIFFTLAGTFLILCTNTPLSVEEEQPSPSPSAGIDSSWVHLGWYGAPDDTVEALLKEDTVRITWGRRISRDSAFGIAATTDSGATWVPLVECASATGDTALVTLPAPPFDSRCSLRVHDTADTLGIPAFQLQSMIITAPEAGSVYFPGDTLTVSWRVFWEITSVAVNLHLSKTDIRNITSDAGASITTAMEQWPAYSWVIPADALTREGYLEIYNYMNPGEHARLEHPIVIQER